ncbi:MAG TPA: hypothetical protein VKE50_02495 [Thermoanaerobaculia bacterium]|nr:hypothetical protein [Thermoanaerobaculia bacterium]
MTRPGTELERMPRELEALFSGEGFAARHGVALPFVTVDPEGYPRAALLSFGEIRARSRQELTVAVRAGSHTAANLIRRRTAMISYLARGHAVWVQVRAGRGRTSMFDPDRQIFPLTVVRVKIDAAGPEEGDAELLTGPILTTSHPERIFSAPLFEELGKGPVE